MAGEEDKSSKVYGALPNVKWPPQRYYNLAAYLLMYNGIVNLAHAYGLEVSNGDQVINDYIKEHLEELIEKPKDSSEFIGEFDFIKRPTDMPPKPLKIKKKPGMSDAEWAEYERQYNIEFAKYNEELDKWKNPIRIPKRKRGPEETDAEWNAYEAQYKAEWEDRDPSQYTRKQIKAVAELKEKRASELKTYKEQISAFKADMPNLIAKAKDFSKKVNGDGKGGFTAMLSDDQTIEMLKEKREAVRKWHEDVRVRATGNSGKNGDKNTHYNDWDNAQATLRDKKKKLSRERFVRFRRLMLTVGSVALAGVSVAGLLASGGAVLGSTLFGTAFKSAGIAGAVFGFVGTVAGWTAAKTFGTKFLTSIGTIRKTKEDIREFMEGYGKYADETASGKVRTLKGYKKIKQRFYEDLAIQKFLEHGGKGVEHLTGDDAYLDKYLQNAIKRKSIFNPYLGEDGGQPLDLKKLQKEAEYYQFVNDENDKKGPKNLNKYGFDRIIAMLGTQKSVNAEGGFSVQGEITLANNMIKDPNTQLLALKEKIEHFDKAKPKFEKNPDNITAYERTNRALSDKLIQAFDNAVFGEPYRSNSVGTLQAIYETDAIKKRFEDTNEGKNGEAAENAIAFIESLGKDTMAGGVLDSSINATVEEQLFMDAEHMSKACKRFVPETIPDPAHPRDPNARIANPDIEKVNNVISQIESARNKEDLLGMVDASIRSINSPDAKAYLTRMKQKKLNETTYGSALATLPSAVSGSTLFTPVLASKVANITSSTSSSEIHDIKNDILSTITDPTDKKQAMAIVDQQIQASARKKRNEVAQRALSQMRVTENAVPDFKKYMDMIPSDSAKDLDPVALSDTLKKFQKIQSPEVREFLIYKLKDKVASILQAQAKSPKFDTKGGDISATITSLQGFIRTIGILEDYKIIESWQKDECSKAIEQKVISAFAPHLEKIEKEFLKDVDTTRETVRLYLQEMKFGGFSEFLNSGTIEATALKDRITRIYEATILSTLMEADSKGAAFGSLVCANSGETQTTLRIYFERERKDGDLLYDLLRKMQDITNTTGGFGSTEDPEIISATSNTEQKIVGTGVVTGIDTNKSFVYRMTQIVNGLDADNATYNDGSGVKTMSSEDMLATLLVMKKRTLAMVKSQMFKLYDRNKLGGESVQNFAIRCGSDFGRIYDKWETLAKEIDDKVNVLQAKVETKYKGYKSCASCIAGGTNYEKYSGYMSSQEMNV